jgi:hypothetical protein
VTLLRLAIFSSLAVTEHSVPLPWWLGFIPAVLLYAAIAFVLTRPAANAYFGPLTGAADAPPVTPLSKE